MDALKSLLSPLTSKDFDAEFPPWTAEHQAAFDCFGDQDYERAWISLNLDEMDDDDARRGHVEQCPQLLLEQWA